jgi:hypothetical protein
MVMATKRHWPTLGAVILFSILGIGLVYTFNGLRDQSHKGVQAHTALCLIEDQYQNTVRTTRRFLRHNRGKKMILGVPRGVFVADNQQLKKRIKVLDETLSGCAESP